MTASTKRAAKRWRPSATPPSSSKNICRARAISKCRFSATITAIFCISANAIARCSAATRKSSKSLPPPISRPKFADELCDAAVRIAREVGYRNAGTVEFLLDVDTGKLYFIEVNPRIQVEHTVTEMVTGIDLVRSQILIAQGHKLHEPPLSLPQQEDMPLHGAALQCRVTTEDPENQFAPDYGKLTTYRSPAGFGIRLDGGTAYSGARLAPYYDSLLVKVTAWDTTLPRRLPPHGSRPARVPHPRREDQHSVPRKCGEPSPFPARRGHHVVSRRIAGAVPFRRAAATAPRSCSPIWAT